MSRSLLCLRCSVQQYWAACRWPREGSPLPRWCWFSPRHPSSLGLWWRASPPDLDLFYSQTSPECSSTNRCRCFAVLWCSLRLWRHQSSSKPTERIWEHMWTHFSRVAHRWKKSCAGNPFSSYSCLSNNEGCFGAQGGKNACHFHCNITGSNNHTAPVGKAKLLNTDSNVPGGMKNTYIYSKSLLR